MTPCTICHEPARWLNDGLPLCSSHVTAELIRTGRPGTQMPAETVEERLDFVLSETEIKTIGRIGGGGGAHMVSQELLLDAAAEIRRLRARVTELEAGQAAG